MLFPTVTFAVFFLIVLPLSWALMRRQTIWRPFMLVASYVFYAWWNWRFVFLLASSTIANQFFGVMIHRAGRQSGRRWLLAGAIAFALVRTGAIGGSGGDNATNPSTGTPAVIALTDAPTGSPSPTPSPSPKAGPPITSPVDVPIMMYHIIGPPDRPANDTLAVSEADFTAQVSYLACAGYTPITVQFLFDAFAGKAALPEKPIILTFDDGWAGQYTYGFPVLQQHGFVGSFAIVTGFVEGGGPYMSWAQIAEMSCVRGIGAHGFEPTLTFARALPAVPARRGNLHPLRPVWHSPALKTIFPPQADPPMAESANDTDMIVNPPISPGI